MFVHLEYPLIVMDVIPEMENISYISVIMFKILHVNIEFLGYVKSYTQHIIFVIETPRNSFLYNVRF